MAVSYRRDATKLRRDLERRQPGETLASAPPEPVQSVKSRCVTDELVSVALIREDLRQLLVAADVYQRERESKGESRIKRLDLAIQRIGTTASSAEWQPKRSEPEEDT